MQLFELTAEQSFLHQRVIRDAEKLNKEELVKVLTDIHRLYLIKGGLFTRLVNWCARERRGTTRVHRAIRRGVPSDRRGPRLSLTPAARSPSAADKAAGFLDSLRWDTQTHVLHVGLIRDA
jgi:hypothetical protein